MVRRLQSLYPSPHAVIVHIQAMRTLTPVFIPQRQTTTPLLCTRPRASTPARDNMWITTRTSHARGSYHATHYIRFSTQPRQRNFRVLDLSFSYRMRYVRIRHLACVPNTGRYSLEIREGILSLVQLSRIPLFRGYYLGTGLISVVGTSFATLSTANAVSRFLARDL